MPNREQIEKIVDDLFMKTKTPVEILYDIADHILDREDRAKNKPIPIDSEYFKREIEKVKKDAISSFVSDYEVFDCPEDNTKDQYGCCEISCFQCYFLNYLK